VADVSLRLIDDMALAEHPYRDRLDPILDEVARAARRHSLTPSSGAPGKGILRVEIEHSVRRVVQVYWTPFEASVPGRSVGLHLEVAEPRVHWAECYLSPEFRSWVFCFAERADGEIQLSYHADYASPIQAIEGFFSLASWYVLTATDLKWSDVVLRLGEAIDWARHSRLQLPAAAADKAVQESLKKSTIFWMRWSDDGTERTMPVWYLFDVKANKIYVLSGERQQTIPGARTMRECDVILRWKGKNASVAELPAAVRALPPGPEWDTVAEKIAEKRLNIPGLPEETAKRWRDECVILELTLLG
jgi:hypothetical protein